eukprot:m51a1_g10383 hypothetical protein (413) ;mRNA; f:54970-75229
MDKYIVAMLQSKGVLYNDFFKSEQNCKKMSLIAMKIIEWSVKYQNKLFNEVSKIPGIDIILITSFEMSSLWKHPMEAVLSIVSLLSVCQGLAVQKNLDIMLLGRFVSWLMNAAQWKWVRGGMNQKDIIKMVMAHKCTKKKKKKVSTGHVEELPSSMSLSQINAQYKFGKVTNIFFSDIFGHVFKCIIGVQAVVQQYMAAKKHSHSIMFEQKKNFFAKFMNTINCIDPSVLALINNNLMAPTPHLCFHSHTNLTNLSFLYLSMSCQMTCLKYIFSDNGTDITTNSALTDLINHWEQQLTEPLSWKELTDKPFKSIMWAVFVFLFKFIQAVSAFEVAIITNIIQWEDESPMSNNDFGLLSSGLSDGLWDNISFNSPVLEPSIIKLKNYIMTRMGQQAKKTNKGKSSTNDETSDQ